MVKITQQTKTDFRQEIGAQIKQRREAKEMSQVELAEALQLQQSRIAELEGGIIKNIDTYIAAIAALGGKLIIKWE